jgi:methionine synthase II (cobalamin-independent)
MAARTTPPFRADHVGSLLRPAPLLAARAGLADRFDFTAGRIDADDLRECEDAAIRDAVALQESIGLKSATEERSGGFEPLRFVRDDTSVVLGLVTTKTPALEQPDALKRRVDEAAKYVDIDRLCLSGQCGFASTVEGNALTIDQEKAKLELIVRVAEEIWG